MQFAELPLHLTRLIDALALDLQTRDSIWWDEPYAPGKWQRRQLAGHLIDSASNNHQRFVRAALTEPGSVFTGPGYDQEGCVRVQRFDALPLPVLTGMLLNYNRLIAHLLDCFPQDRLATPCLIAAYPSMTIETVAISYVAHLEHHLRQLAGDASLPFSGLPWPFPK
jgi:DinB superfamily